ncbi:efflux transporter outer membrane subunit [Acetobacter sp. AAB5]|uniref:efflux transporter outer membrane subunit n=1 Tax=Acetobacter sp. AAB5 TaxID=3418370 RepID=UPI003CE8E971
MIFMFPKFQKNRIALLLPVVFLEACSLQPKTSLPKVTLPQAWENTPAQQFDGKTQKDWWQNFHQPKLNNLVSIGLQENIDINIAYEKLQASRIETKIAYAANMPEINGTAGYSRNYTSTAGIGDVLRPLLGLDQGGSYLEPKGVSYSNFNTGMFASWELDLWGRYKLMRKVADANRQAFQDDIEAVSLSFEAEICRLYFLWVNLTQMVEVEKKASNILKEIETINNASYQRGLISQTVLLEQSNQFHKVFMKYQELDNAQQAVRRALSTLVYNRPDALSVNDQSFLPIDYTQITPAPLKIPSVLVQSRPDIRAAEQRLHAASAMVGIARADFYPRITFSGELSIDALTLTEFGWGARNTQFGPTLTLPIFEGGKIARQVELRQTELKNAGLEYKRTVLNAWKETEDALANYNMTRAQYGDAAQMAENAKISEKRVGASYRRGDESKVEFLVSQLASLDCEIELLNMQQRLMENYIRLYVVSGG